MDLVDVEVVVVVLFINHYHARLARLALLVVLALFALFACWLALFALLAPKATLALLVNQYASAYMIMVFHASRISLVPTGGASVFCCGAPHSFTHYDSGTTRDQRDLVSLLVVAWSI